MPRRRTHVLVLHRDQNLAERIRMQFEHLHDMQIAFVKSCDGINPTSAEGADVIVLDLSAAAPPGFEVFRILQSRCAAPPVIVLRRRPDTPRNTAGHSVEPDGLQALEARLHRALGRSVHLAWLPVRYQDLHLRAELPHPHVLVDGLVVAISQREGELLGLLLAQVNRVVPREVIIAEIWGYETRSLDVHVRRLRQKLGVAGRQIETVTGFGYRFVEAKAPLADRGAGSVVGLSADVLPVVARS